MLLINTHPKPIFLFSLLQLFTLSRYFKKDSKSLLKLTYFPRHIIFYFLLSPLFSNAQQTRSPNAGSLEQSIKEELRQSLPTQIIRADNLILNQPIEVEIEAIKFQLEHILFTGNTLLSNAQIELLIEPYLNKNIDIEQLKILTRSIEEDYRKKGSIARVITPAQEIRNKTLHIQIEESVYGHTVFQGDVTRVKVLQIKKLIDTALDGTKLLDLDSVDRGLLLADDLPGISVSGLLTQGSIPLSTDLIVSSLDEPLLNANVQFDNTGPKAIGVSRLLTSLALNSPLKIGDLLSAFYLHSQGSDYERLSYTLPVGNTGWRFGLNASNMNYRLVSSDFASLDATGTSTSKGIEAAYPVIRSKPFNLYLTLNGDSHFFSNANSEEGLVSQYSIKDYSAALRGNSYDNFGAQGSNSFSLALTSGYTNLIGSPNQVAVMESNNTQGGFFKTNYSVNREQSLDNLKALQILNIKPKGLSLYASLTGQAANKNLDASEMFYLGGILGVRAYPTNSGGGSQGQLGTVELRQTLNQNIKLALFFDYGRIQINPNNTFPGAATLNNYDLKGSGLSIGLQPKPNIDLKAIWAERVGVDPNTYAFTNSGIYTDVSGGKSQLWLTASIGF